MKAYRRIGVFLTGSPADEAALGYAGEFARLAGSEKVVCVYARDDDDAIDLDKLREKVLGQLPEEASRNAAVEIQEGRDVTAVLRASLDLDLDLIVKGRRLSANQSAVGEAFTRLARKAPCSVLIVPNFSRPHMNRLLVPVDCSAHSKMTLEAALEIARGAGADSQVVVHTVGCVGYGYHKLGLSLEEAVAEQTAALSKQLTEFLSDVDRGGVEFESICTCSEDTAVAVHEMASARKMDMIVVGSRGLSDTAAAILGSNAERILMHAAIPVLIIKKKGETTGLLKALLQS